MTCRHQKRPVNSGVTTVIGVTGGVSIRDTGCLPLYLLSEARAQADEEEDLPAGQERAGESGGGSTQEWAV